MSTLSAPETPECDKLRSSSELLDRLRWFVEFAGVSNSGDLYVCNRTVDSI